MKSGRKERIGWYFYDWANSAFYTTVITVFLGPYLTSVADAAADASGYVYVLGIPIASGSFFPYIVSLSVLLQVLVLPIVGSYADYTKKKKLILGITAYLGAFAAMGLYFLEGTNFLLGGTLFIIANIFFGSSIVVYNSILADISSVDKRDSVSSIGWAIGYLGGGIVLALNLFLYSQAESIGITEGFAVRISLFSAGAWWALFTIIPMFTLKNRKKKTGPSSNNKVFFSGFKELIATLKDAAKHPKTLIFLIAYLLYNDGVQTVIVISSLFGQKVLNLSLDTLTQIILMVQFIAILGSLLFNWIAKIVGSKNAIVLSLVIWCLVLVYAYSILETEFQFWILAGVIGIVLGGTQAISRSLYSKLIPKNKEAAYFSVYEVSEKGTSWLGPLMFGLAYQWTGSYKIAMLSLIIFFVAGLIVLLKLRLDQKA